MVPETVTNLMDSKLINQTKECFGKTIQDHSLLQCVNVVQHVLAMEREERSSNNLRQLECSTEKKKPQKKTM